MGGILEVDTKKEVIEGDEQSQGEGEEENAEKSSGVLDIQSELVKRVNVQGSNSVEEKKVD